MPGLHIVADQAVGFGCQKHQFLGIAGHGDGGNFLDGGCGWRRILGEGRAAEETERDEAEEADATRERTYECRFSHTRKIARNSGIL